jgi:hypothetical protein
MGIAGDDSPELLARIASISDQPEPAGLVTFGYLPKGGAFLPQICDPFGFGCDEKMWRQLQRIARDDEGAAGAQSEMLRRAQVENLPALEEQILRERQRAEAEIVEMLSLDIKTFPAVFEHLVDSAYNLSLAKLNAENAHGQLASVMQFCRKTIETLIKEMARQSPLKDAHKLLNGDASLDRAIAEKIAASMGFNCPLPIALQNVLSGGSLSLSRIKSICRDLKNVYSLPAALIATLLAASKDLSHPFRSAAIRDPELLAKFVSIIELGNAGSHDDSHSPAPKRFSISEADEMWHLTMQATGCALNIPFRKR